ncbi:MAG: nuclear transport factor 2 family protein [Betaproteobacteria bacterium]
MTDTAPNRAATLHAKAFFETIAPADVGRIDTIYAGGATFRDPFNEVRGVAAIEAVYRKMFEHLDDVRFTFVETVVDAGGAMLIWDMSFRVRKWRPAKTQRIHGASHLKFAVDGRIAYHRDYWDTANELYAKLPLVGPLMRWLKRRLG